MGWVVSRGNGLGERFSLLGNEPGVAGRVGIVPRPLILFFSRVLSFLIVFLRVAGRG